MTVTANGMTPLKPSTTSPPALTLYTLCPFSSKSRVPVVLSTVRSSSTYWFQSSLSILTPGPAPYRSLMMYS
ncbi:hypothetical protein EVAR_93221_1 [Eumeta japonica]|uniref:Uncharacterized protein n=1 Tax=Eumeta variegata TaxID=151549 RepID=A0A4C1TXK3_EUMVA|nr:hypothetical protein EVAR_93221_1 [Eumeta japonica]